MSAILILCYNKAELSRRCIQSTLDAGYAPGQITVIDNGSTPALLPSLRSEFPWLQCIRLERNGGFAGGFTQGIRQFFMEHPEETKVLFLTNDTRPQAGCLEACEHTAGVTQAQLVAPRLLFRNHAERIDSIGGHFDRHTGTLHHHKSLGLPVLLGPDDYIPGTALWMTRPAFEQLGGTDERYVMYWEDVDFCFRAHHAGIRQARCEAALIGHGIGQTCHKKPLYSTYYFQRNRIRFCQNWLSPEEWASVSQCIRCDLESLRQRALQRADPVRESYLNQLITMLSAGEIPI